MARLGLIQRALRQAYREARAAGVPDEITHGYLRFGPEGMTPAARRARAAEGGFMLEMPLYRGDVRDVAAFDDPTSVYRHERRHSPSSRAVFAAVDRPDVAEHFANSPAPNAAPQIQRLFHRADRPVRVDMADDDTMLGLAATLDDAFEAGADSALIRNYRGVRGLPPSDIVAMRNPANIRSENAVFDQARRRWNSLLAATTTGAPIGLLALLRAEQDV